MGALTLYAIKSSITLALLYLPYALMLRKETFFRLNRAMLLAIVAISLVVPCIKLPSPLPSSQVGELITDVVMLPTLVVGAKAEPTASPQINWVVAIYVIGMLSCLLWKFVGLVRLVHFIPRGCLWTDNVDGATVYCHIGQVSPFSWMRSVVIGENPLPSSPKGEAILQHELAHVRMRHSWDTLIVSLVEVLQWFNPMIWMLDASLSEVHEYEADDAVLRRGISARDYQLLLIEKAVAHTPYPMVHAFRHSQLKNRITMMTKKKSPRWARLKVLYAVPLTLVALGAMASQQMKKNVAPLTLVNNKRVTKDMVKQLDPKDISHIEVLHAESAQQLFGEEAKEGAVMITTKQEKTIKVAPGTLRIVVDGQEMTEQEAMKAVQGKEIKNEVKTNSDGETELLVATASPDDKVYDKPEVLPEFPGGMNEMFGWMSRNVKYPKEALEYGVQGRIIVEFVVEKDGSITNIREIKGAGKDGGIIVNAYKAKDESSEELKKENEDKGRISLQDEAKRVVKAMPKWTPGRDNGQPVRTKFVLPVMFRLS